MQYCRNFETLIIQRNLGNKKVKESKEIKKGKNKIKPPIAGFKINEKKCYSWKDLKF